MPPLPATSTIEIEDETTRWLHHNFERDEGSSVGLKAVYKQFQQRCVEKGRREMSKIGFGKLRTTVVVTI
jgi:hypothetical protein